MSRTRQNAILLAALLFSQLVLMAASARGADGVSTLRNWVSRTSGPFVATGGNVGAGIRRTTTGARDLWQAHVRNQDLERELQRLRAELRIQREAALENRRLRRLLEMRENLAPRSIGASVVTLSVAAENQIMVIDRGIDDGIRISLPVVAWGGAVGRVVEVDARYAVVRLLSDPLSGVAGVVQRSRAQGLVEGRGGDALDLLYVPRFSDVIHGDRVVTSGLDGVFPRGFGIGRVSAVREVPDGSQSIQLEPEIEYRSLEEVLVLLEAHGGELLAPTGVERPQ